MSVWILLLKIIASTIYSKISIQLLFQYFFTKSYQQLYYSKVPQLKMKLLYMQQLFLYSISKYTSYHIYHIFLGNPTQKYTIFQTYRHLGIIWKKRILQKKREPII